MQSQIMLSKIKMKENYRQNYDEKSISELAKSIKEVGLIQPIMVNQTGVDEYYIVFGHRRFKAAKEAGLISIPCEIRENMTDAEVLSVQLLENVQRKDVEPWDEAAGYAKLHKSMPLNEISARTGKTISHIQLRLALNDLDTFWMELFKLGKIDSTAALLIARLPKVAQEKLQNSLSEGNVPNTKQIITTIETRIMLILKDQKFPLDKKFGACGISCLECKKRTGGNELFPEITETDHCMDSDCFDDKKKAFLEEKLKAVYDKYPDIVKITDHYFDKKISETEKALGHEKYLNVPEERANEEDVLRAVYIEGNYAGNMTYIKLKTFTENQLSATPVVDQKEQRKIKRLEKEARMLALEEIKLSFGNNNTKLLDYFIAENMAGHTTNGWAYKDQVKWLQDNFKFSEFKGDPTGYSARRQWIVENLANIPQPGMKINCWLFFRATKESIGSDYTVYNLAEFVGVSQKKEFFIEEAKKNQEKVKSVGMNEEEEKTKKKEKTKEKKEKPASPKSKTVEQKEAVEQDNKEEEEESTESKIVLSEEEYKELDENDDEEFGDEHEGEEEEEEEEEFEDTSTLPRFSHDF